MEIWNAHRIQHQRKKFNSVTGIPNELYMDQSLPRYGWHPDLRLLAELKEAVKDVGKYLLPIIF